MKIDPFETDHIDVRKTAGWSDAGYYEVYSRKKGLTSPMEAHLSRMERVSSFLVIYYPIERFILAIFQPFFSTGPFDVK